MLDFNLQLSVYLTLIKEYYMKYLLMIVGLFLFMGSNFWIWELNESWPVKAVAKMVSKYELQEVFITGIKQVD